MKDNYIEITLHLINGEGIKYAVSMNFNDARRLLDKYMDKDVHYLNVGYDMVLSVYWQKQHSLH